VVVTPSNGPAGKGLESISSHTRCQSSWFGPREVRRATAARKGNATVASSSKVVMAASIVSSAPESVRSAGCRKPGAVQKNAEGSKSELLSPSRGWGSRVLVAAVAVASPAPVLGADDVGVALRVVSGPGGGRVVVVWSGGGCLLSKFPRSRSMSSTEGGAWLRTPGPLVSLSAAEGLCLLHRIGRKEQARSLQGLPVAVLALQIQPEASDRRSW
jgi:hypothetical protein